VYRGPRRQGEGSRPTAEENRSGARGGMEEPTAGLQEDRAGRGGPAAGGRRQDLVGSSNVGWSNCRSR
jgi:hypothetical protein